MAASDHLNEILFHSSHRDFNDFMRAPAIHVGSEESAEEIARSSYGLGLGLGLEDPKIHRLRLSKHSEIAPEVFTDPQANRAHAIFLEEKGLSVPGSVSDSYIGEDKDSPSIQRAVSHLKEGRTIKYINDAEDIGSISYVVPAPLMNLRKHGDKDTHQQPPLPMDYSLINPSKQTRAELYFARKFGRI